MVELEATQYLPKIKKNSRSKSLLKNSVIDSLYRTRLYELAMSRFKWENLPDEIDERFLELSLNQYGAVGFFFEDTVQKYTALPMMINGNFNIYMNPEKISVWSPNGYHADLNENFVPIYNNMLRQPTTPWLDYYAEILYDVDQTRIINIKAQKTPIIIRCTDRQRLTFKNIYLEYDGNSPVIVVDDSVNTDQIQVLETKAPFIASELTDIRRQIFGEVLMYLGYSTHEATQKRERLLVGELTAAESEASSSRFSPLIMRRMACDSINKMFGLNISVNFRQGSSTIIDLDNPMEQLMVNTYPTANNEQAILNTKKDEGDSSE